MRLLAANLPPVSQDFFDKLKASFPPSEIDPDSEINKIMYDAGQQSVIAWVAHAVRGAVITGGAIDSRSGQ